MFTDLESSTRLWEQHSGPMQGALARHDAILRTAIEGRGGYVVKTTGDGGSKGLTTFGSLQPGTYTLTEDVPATAVTSYGFCGPTLDSSTVTAVNNKLSLNVTSGATWYCAYFNVPDDLSDSRGAIQVRKFTCDAASYPAGYDYDANCDPAQTPPEQFRLDLCAATSRPVAANELGVIEKVIPGGRCAVLRHTGSDDTLGAAIHFLYSSWLPASGEEPRDFPLYLQRVTFFPDVPEHEAISDLFLPLR